MTRDERALLALVARHVANALASSDRLDDFQAACELTTLLDAVECDGAESEGVRHFGEAVAAVRHETTEKVGRLHCLYRGPDETHEAFELRLTAHIREKMKTRRLP